MLVASSEYSHIEDGYIVYAPGGPELGEENSASLPRTESRSGLEQGE